MNVGPKGYILAARLHEARRKLMNRRFQDYNIAEIAMNCGFAHMGRFAHQYKTYFGLLSSEERSPVINYVHLTTHTIENDIQITPLCH